MKVVVNSCFGGFSLSLDGCFEYARLSGFALSAYDHDYESGRYYKIKDAEKSFCPLYIKGDMRADSYSKKEFSEIYNKKENRFSCRDLSRTDPILIQVAETLGQKANGRCAEIEIREIPDDISWEIDEYDGIETIREKHRSW